MVRFLAILFASYSAYSFWVAQDYGKWGYAFFGAVSLGTAIFLWFKKAWSQYLVYVLGAVFIGAWLFAVWQVYERGWPYEDALRSFISLVPGLLMVFVVLGACYIVRRAFRRER